MTTTSGSDGFAATVERAIERGLRALIDPGRVFEVRIPETRKKTVSGYFDDISVAAAAAAEWDGQAQGVYCTFNWINPALLARSANRLREYVKTTTGDADIERRIWLYIDLDPKGPAGISATNEEHEAVLTRAYKIVACLSAFGWPLPLIVDSGNGVHLYYRIDLPNDTESLALVEGVLKALVSKFEDDKVRVDTSGKNASRIAKIPGTLACKGDDTKDRPHRRSRIIEQPLVLEVVTRDQLLDVAAEYAPRDKDQSQEQSSLYGSDGSGDRFLRNYLELHRDQLPEWGPERPLSGGGWKVEFEHCPWNPDHQTGSAFVGVNKFGAIVAGCLHNSCSGQNWATLRELIEGPRPPHSSGANGRSASGEPGPKTAAADGDDQKQKKSQASRLVELAHAQNVELFHDHDGRAYASLAIGGHRETWPTKSKAFKDFLSRQFYLAEKTSPSTQAIKDAIGTLDGEALYAGPLRDVFVRVAELDGRIYLDLGNEDWTAIEISAEGWKPVKDPPVWFRRPRGMRPLPVPAHGGRLKDELGPFLNVANEDELQLVCSWQVAGLRGKGPYTILCFIGEHGSAKSTNTIVVRRPLDPFEAELRTVPRNEHDLQITAYNSHVVALDNVGHLPAWLSDAMCRLSTGGGLATRELYEDSEEIIFDAQRPQVMNSIKDVATRPDFLDRALVITVPEIDDGRRQERETLLADFEKALPRILGALLSAVSGALRDLESVKLLRKPRMADFARWSVAAEQHMGFAAGSFIKAYEKNMERVHDAVLEASPISPYLFELVEKHPDGWIGTCGELLETLNSMAPEKKSESWPRSPRGLSGELRQLAVTLRKRGILFKILGRGERGIRISLSKVRKTPSAPSEPSAAATGAGSRADGRGDGDEGRPSADGQRVNDRKQRTNDGTDGTDGHLHTSESVNPHDDRNPDTATARSESHSAGDAEDEDDDEVGYKEVL